MSEEEAPEPTNFPSVQTSSPLVASYTFHSVDPPVSTTNVASNGKSKEVEEERPKIEGNWMLGVDEAGRGPVLGAFRVGRVAVRVLGN